MLERAVLLAAGGTGGHLFPAEALAAVLIARGVPVDLMTDVRAARYAAAFPARATYTVASATPTGKGALNRMQAMMAIARGTWTAGRIIRRTKPLCVVGFGGYPTVPPLLAATQLGVPGILHEQNAVMGRANRFLASRVTRIATGFALLAGVAPALRAKAVQTGNPIRPAVGGAADVPYPDFEAGILNILVTGGSQGARVMADVVPAAIGLLPPDLRARVKIVQQARGEDAVRVVEAYRKLAVDATVAPFFDDLPARMAAAHLVIGRAGASTVSELAVIGRPALLVPFPHALDQDQAANAEQLASCGAAEVIRQTSFTPQRLAETLTHALAAPQSLTDRAAAAKSAGIPDAAERLADLVFEVIGRPTAEKPSAPVLETI